MNHSDTVAVLRSAHKAGIPPMQFSVLAALLCYTNSRWMCHPGQRTLAKVCSINKDSVTMCVKWLSDNGMIRVYSKPRKVNCYEIVPRTKWKTVRPHRTANCPTTPDTLRIKLSGSTAQLPVRPHRTDENRVYTENCPATSDVNGRADVAATEQAASLRGDLEAPAVPVNGHKLAF